ncbi:hypothetical protein A2630_04045 [Candidatus Woesebacteria bacterium RIFCSPHIGHO2_01_FULL_44_10]|uniref:Uncharacterized protein n=1 Tax=Candidatus Woesebacteria bacterium RIFCSPLOWO2_01_FULL_44_14 TaxID=1802525 RepID=A0A1F8C242_9BACT|nr:MAG: hypothetical protein A2630_04045 [Candidatus Woesebacteria bacterium RIFCSPHIGHO2_01_FULL_44_10]OGM54513.1 MAG: hypothetical protein A3F62_03175 [Candidatus Woesebacteria bacterium RIFCSPHIGHO2_12_FULL_44_11]OGM70407.1 MAG: hypothetical protein A2975_01735 [Candidatus Woesebacteria bacterium RIFCSPLOWO2_01_FULL_44_14]
MALTKSDKQYIDQKLSNLKSDFFDKLDDFVKEVRDSHEERTIIAHRVSDHEDRITSLEAVVIQ